MSYKKVDIPKVGLVTFYKKKGIKNIKLTVVQGGVVRVSLPYWLPYSSAIPFLKSKSDWINKQKEKLNLLLSNEQPVGKDHQLLFLPDKTVTKIGSKVTGSKINIIYPISLSWEDSEVQEKARKIVVKTLKVESSRLIERLYLLSDTSGIKYKNADTRVLKTRWGSCNSEHEIVLNIYLIQLPWELIDYVIMHELTHTKFLNHSADFWKELEKYLPNYKTCQKEIKKFQPFGKVDEKSLGL